MGTPWEIGYFLSIDYPSNSSRVLLLSVLRTQDGISDESRGRRSVGLSYVAILSSCAYDSSPEIPITCACVERLGLVIDKPGERHID